MVRKNKGKTWWPIQLNIICKNNVGHFSTGQKGENKENMWDYLKEQLRCARFSALFGRRIDNLCQMGTLMLFYISGSEPSNWGVHEYMGIG